MTDIPPAPKRERPTPRVVILERLLRIMGSEQAALAFIEELEDACKESAVHRTDAEATVLFRHGRATFAMHKASRYLLASAEGGVGVD